MCFDELIGTITLSVSRLLYIRLHTNECKIVYALSDVPELVHVHCTDQDELQLTWAGITRLLTTMCSPAFIQAGAILMFQPEFVTGLNRHADERAYFVIVLFPGGHNLALGTRTMVEREELYLMFCELLALNPSDESPPPVIQ